MILWVIAMPPRFATNAAGPWRNSLRTKWRGVTIDYRDTLGPMSVARSPSLRRRHSSSSFGNRGLVAFFITFQREPFIDCKWSIRVLWKEGLILHWKKE